MTNWRAQRVQFVWFTASAHEVSADALYLTIWGEDAETTQRNKIPTPANPFLTQAQGRVGNFVASVQTQPGRVDLLVMLPEDGETHPWQQDLMDVEEWLSRISDKVLAAEFEGVQNTFRQSVVVNLAEPVEEYGKARGILYDLIGFNPGLDGVTEVVFQLNRRTKLDSKPEIELNRLLNYSVGAYQFFRMEIDSMSINHVPMMQISYAATVTVDINTVPTGATYDAAEQREIWIDVLNQVRNVTKTVRIDSLADKG